MYRRLFFLTTALIVSGVIFLAASSTGKVGRTNLSDTKGCTCHGASPSTAVQVVIEGPDTITSGTTAAYQVRISGGPAVAAGTNIAASAGSLNPVDGNLQILSGELTHTAPLNFPVGGMRFFSLSLQHRHKPVR